MDVGEATWVSIDELYETDQMRIDAISRQNKDENETMKRLTA